MSEQFNLSSAAQVNAPIPALAPTLSPICASFLISFYPSFYFIYPGCQQNVLQLPILQPQWDGRGDGSAWGECQEKT